MIYYETEEGFKPLGTISEIELTAETIEDNEIKQRFFDSKPIEITATIDEKSADRLERAILGQSAYNAKRLKEDGYLSPENGWIK